MFARTAAAIDPAWAEALAGDLAKRQISEPHWSKEAGAAVAFEKVTLFGVEIVPRRRVQFARIDRAAARELFLRHALVEGEWDPARIDKRVSAFWRSNAELRRRLEKLEERERRRDILVGDEAVFRFYDQRIPVDVFDVRSFEAWWREALATTPRLLVMREDDLLDDAERADQHDFPTRWTQADQVLGLAYRFEPGAADDGVSVGHPARAAAAGAGHGLRLAGAGAARRARDRAAAGAAEGDPPPCRARRGLGRDIRRRARRRGPGVARGSAGPEPARGARPAHPAARQPADVGGGLRDGTRARASADELPRRGRARSRGRIRPGSGRAAARARRPLPGERLEVAEQGRRLGGP